MDLQMSMRSYMIGRLSLMLYESVLTDMNELPHSKEHAEIIVAFIVETLHKNRHRIIGPEITEEMHRAAKDLREADKAKGRPTPWGSIFDAMADVGDIAKGD
jgi:hypothetical protein